MKIKTLKSRWNGLFQSIAGTVSIEHGFNDLVGRYSEAHRHYHNLDHVNGCLEAFDPIAHHLSDPFSIESAIWFHDVVYDPKSSKNEARSADYATAFLARTEAGRQTVTEIDRLIRLTRHPSHPSTEDEKYLIDIDLATLGAERSRYDQYEVMIRKEYGYVPGLLYKRGRRKILTAFLDCRYIYRTRHFRDRFEDKARANIERALKNL